MKIHQKEALNAWHANLEEGIQVHKIKIYINQRPWRFKGRSLRKDLEELQNASWNKALFSVFRLSWGKKSFQERKTSEANKKIERGWYVLESPAWKSSTDSSQEKKEAGFKDQWPNQFSRASYIHIPVASGPQASVEWTQTAFGCPLPLLPWRDIPPPIPNGPFRISVSVAHPNPQTQRQIQNAWS